MADEVHNPPTEIPRPTDQGDSGLCTRHAIGNTIASEGMKHKVDFNLDTAITALVQFESDRNVHIGIKPLDFHKKVVVIQDQKSKAWYHVDLTVERCNTAQCQADIGKDQFVLVYPPNPSQGGTHCVYVQNIEKTRSGDCFRCINSWGKREETPLININSQRIEIYKVMIQLTVNRSQDVSESTDISALSMNLNERLHITGVIYLKKKSDYEKFKALHATKRLSCKADIPIHCPVSNHIDLSNLTLIPTGFTNVIVEGDVHLQTASDYSDIVKYSCHAAVHCHINAMQDISNLSTLAGRGRGRYNVIVEGSRLELRSSEDAQVFRQLSTTCRVTYSLQELLLHCDVSGGEVDWLDWLAELVSAVPTVVLWPAVKLTDNICGAVARRLEQPGAKLQDLRLLQCDMSLVSGAALADVWAKVSQVGLYTKLTEAQAVGVAGRLEGRAATLELLKLHSYTDVSGVSGGAMGNLMRRVSRVTTEGSGFSMTKTNVREMMGRLKQIGLTVDTGRLKMDGRGEEVKLYITKDATGVKLSGS